MSPLHFNVVEGTAAAWVDRQLEEIAVGVASAERRFRLLLKHGYSPLRAAYIMNGGRGNRKALKRWARQRREQEYRLDRISNRRIKRHINPWSKG